MAKRGKRIPGEVLVKARAAVHEAPALEPPRERKGSKAERRPEGAVKAKVLARLRRLHPMD